MEDTRREVTRLLRAGEHGALMTLVYDELRAMAARRLVLERHNHTLQATALVNETFLRLFECDGSSWEERRHFFATAADAMHRILVEHARRVGAQKRGGQVQRVVLGAEDIAVEFDRDRVESLREGLEALEREDERAAAVARLRFLVGLSVEETAEALGISVRTVHREWSFARARLFQLLDL